MAESTPSETKPTSNPSSNTTHEQHENRKKQKQKSAKQKQPQKQEVVDRGRKQGGGGGGGGNSQKLRGMERDSPEVRLSKTMSWILRHAATSEGLTMREDGFARVDDLLKNSRLQPLGLTLERLKGIVSADAKQRFSLVFEQRDGTRLAYTAVDEDGDGKGVWLIKANQGHSMTTVKVELKPILSISDIPSRLAVHGTTNSAWEIIEKEGLSKMGRNHIHLAQGVGGDNVISGMRRSSQILIFINVQKALNAGIKFHLSDNGVVLTEGDKKGYLQPEFFDRVENARTRKAVEGWEGSGDIENEAVTIVR